MAVDKVPPRLLRTNRHILLMGSVPLLWQLRPGVQPAGEQPPDLSASKPQRSSKGLVSMMTLPGMKVRNVKSLVPLYTLRTLREM